MRPILTLAVLIATPVFLHAQSGSFERSVAAPPFSIDAMARAAQLAPDQGRCIFVSNVLIGALGDADVLVLRMDGTGNIVQDLTLGDAGAKATTTWRRRPCNRASITTSPATRAPLIPARRTRSLPFS